MKFVRFLHQDLEYFGKLNSHSVDVLEGNFDTGFKETDITFPLNEIKFLAPTTPSKAVCIGLNYADHIEEVKFSTPEEPVIFLKPPSSIVAHNEKIVYPKKSERLDFEGELAVVIGSTAKNIAAEDADKYIFGYTCANDVTARDLQKPDEQWTVAKGFDTFLPLGPCIRTDIQPGNLEITTRLNGTVMQQSNTKMLLRDVPQLLAYVSSVMTLLPGDILLTGTPAGIAPMNIGDVVSVEIEGIGKLENEIISE